MEQTPYTTEDNVKLLASWNAWKEVCSVHGIGKKRGREPAIGTAEDEKRLARIIAAAFHKKLRSYASLFEPGWTSDGDVLPNEILATDWAHVFDRALIEYEHVDRYEKGCEGDPGKIRPKKAWKDFVWKAVAQSTDSPTRVICGMLLGPKGIHHDICKDWLLERFSAHFATVKDSESGMKKRMLRVDDSLEFLREKGREAGGEGMGDAPGMPETGEGDSMECQDSSSRTEGMRFDGEKIVDSDEDSGNEEEAEPVSSVGEDIAVPKTWRDAMEKAFSPRLCCLMVAHIHGLKLYKEKEILDALGIKKTIAASDLAKLADNEKFWEGIDLECRQWLLDDVAGTRFFKKWIIMRCKAEKAGALILSRVDTNAALAAE